MTNPSVEAEFKYPEIPHNASHEMHDFLIELRNMLQRKFIGAFNVGGDINVGSIISDPDGPVRPARRAKIQTSGIGASSISCKLLDAAGAETGDAITVYPINHLGTNDLTGEVHPKYVDTSGNEDTICVFQDLNDEWYTLEVFEDTDEYP